MGRELAKEPIHAETVTNRLLGHEADNLSDIERVLNAPVLGTIPRIQTNKRPRYELVTKGQPRSSATEAFRSLRTNLQFLMNQQNLRSVLITSPSAVEGKSSTSANLAVVLA